MVLGETAAAWTPFISEMATIQMYTTRWCGYCVRAKALLDAKGLAYEEISLDENPAFRQQLHELTGAWTVPQIMIDGQPIGGYTELWRLDRSGELEQRLAA
jgi:glutaredoxin 3